MFKLNSVSIMRLTTDSGARAVWSASPPGSHDLVPSASPIVSRDASANRKHPGPLVKLDSSEAIEIHSAAQCLELSEWLKDAAMWITAVHMVSMHMEEEIEMEFEEEDEDGEEEVEE